MNNPPNQPRDDRRMHEGEKKGLGGTINHADQDEITPGREPEKSSTDRAQPSPLEEDVERRSNA